MYFFTWSLELYRNNIEPVIFNLNTKVVANEEELQEQDQYLLVVR